MSPIRRCWVGLAVAGVAACHHRASPVAPRPARDPQVLLAEARHQFHRGSFTKALQALQRLTFELPPDDSAVAEVRYDIGECYF